MFCPECGQPVEEGSIFCGACGARLDDDNSQSGGSADMNFDPPPYIPEENPVQPDTNPFTPDSGDEEDYGENGGGKKKVIIGVVIAVILAAVIAVVQIFALPSIKNLKKDKDTTKTDAATSTDVIIATDDDPATLTDATTEPVTEETSAEETTADSVIAGEYMISYETPSHAGVIMRSKSSSESGPIRTLAEGTQITVTNRVENGYTYVMLKSQPSVKGWVMTRYITELAEHVTTTQAATTAPANSFFRPDKSLYLSSEYTAYAFCIETSVQDYVKMRSGPDKYKYDVVTVLDNNTRVTVETKSVDGWTLCVANGTEGWIRSDFLFDKPYGTSAPVDVHFSPVTDSTRVQIGSTNAVIGENITVNGNAPHEIGFTLYDASMRELSTRYFTTDDNGTRFYFDINEDMDYVLTPDTLYYYRCMAVIGGDEYYSSAQSFRTNG